MDVQFLKSFVAVVEHGSLAEAARRLDLTPAALAARIQALEKELGVRLVMRTGRSVKASPAGLKIMERARSVLREVRDLQAIAGDGAVVGELRLGVFVSAMTSVLPRVLARLYAAQPGLKVFVQPGTSADLCQRVAVGELDAAIVVQPSSNLGKQVEWHQVVGEVLVVVAPADHAGRDAHEVLRTAPFIRYDRGVVGGQLADRYLRDHALRPHQRLELDGMMAIAELVAFRLGVSLLPDWAPLWRAQLQIARLALPGRSPLRYVGVVWGRQGPRAALVPAVNAAVDATWRDLVTKERPG